MIHKEIELKMEDNKILNFSASKRNHRSINSNGIKEAWRWLKKNNFFGEEPVTELQLGTIVKKINELVVSEVSKGKDVTIPYLGRLTIVRKERVYKRDNGKIITNLQVDWKKTLQLWAEDNASRIAKQLVFEDCSDVYHIKLYWNNVPNRSFYKFFPSKNFKIKLRDNIKSGITDALLK